MGMQLWLIYAAITAVFLASADCFIKAAAGRISSSLGLLVYGACTFATGLGWVLLERLRGITLHAQPVAFLYALGVGFSFSAVTVGLYATFGAGAPISLASPFVRLAGLVIASIVGLTLFNEPLTLRYVFGMVLVFGGLYLILTR
jgi:drug/metabolite transporter (DMT)-like permease